MSNVLFFRRSYAYRHAAVQAIRAARALPVGSERNAQRKVAHAFHDLARTEAWLEGQSFNVYGASGAAIHRLRQSVRQRA